MKSPFRLNRQSKHTLAKLGLRGVKAGNLTQHGKARRRNWKGWAVN
jgi:hypothetical protein